MRVNENAVTNEPIPEKDWRSEMDDLLRRSREKMHASGILLTWLRSEFSELPHDPSDHDILHAARAYVLDLIKSVIFTDSVHNKVHYKWLTYLRHIDYVGSFSWGGVILSNLYNEMTRVGLRV